jgi:hypothetical protein
MNSARSDGKNKKLELSGSKKQKSNSKKGESSIEMNTSDNRSGL